MSDVLSISKIPWEGWGMKMGVSTGGRYLRILSVFEYMHHILVSVSTCSLGLVLKD